MQKKILYSTRKKISENYLNFLENVPGFIDGKNYKKECELDVDRRGIKGLMIEEKDVGAEFQTRDAEYKNSQDKFEFARNRIEAEAKNIGVSNENAKYFSFLMINLCAQGFYALPLIALSKKYPELYNRDGFINAGEEQQKIVRNNYDGYTLKLENNKLVVEFNFYVYSVENNNPHHGERTLSYTFYPDKTMQISMDNPIDWCHDKLIEYFQDLASMSDENLRSLYGASYKENHPYDFLAMNCDQEKCKIVTRLVALGKNPEAIKNKEIDQIYAIERLSKANPYTVARLVHNYMKDNGENNLDLSNDLYEKLSEEAKENIKKIANEIKDRIDNRDSLELAFNDLINIIVDCFLSILKFFGLELGESAVFSKEFDDFCKKLYSNESLAEDQQSYFTQQYLELKKSTNELGNA